MSDPVSVCNQALAAVGTRSTITSLLEQSNEAIACNQIYDSTRLRTIRGAPWGIAKKFEQLTLWKAAPGTPQNPNANPSVWTPAYPPPPWLYSYLYPSDCLWMRFLIPQWNFQPTGVNIFPQGNLGYFTGYDGPVVKYSIATDVDESGNQIKVILTNQPDAIACYNRDVPDTNVWDPDFLDAIVFALAAQLTQTLTGDKGLIQLNYQLANRKMQEARDSDNNESVVVQDIIPDFIRARGYGAANQAALGGIAAGSTTWGSLWSVPV